MSRVEFLQCRGQKDSCTTGSDKIRTHSKLEFVPARRGGCDGRGAEGEVGRSADAVGRFNGGTTFHRRHKLGLSQYLVSSACVLNPGTPS